MVEVIDYDFGVESDGHLSQCPRSRRRQCGCHPHRPAPFITESFFDHEIRIGHPQITISGRHRYRIQYTLNRDAVVQNGFFSWDAVGLEWTVPIEEATVFVALPEPTGTNCRAGTPWFSKGCSLTTLASGALRIDLADLDANEGATVSASLEAASFRRCQRAERRRQGSRQRGRRPALSRSLRHSPARRRRCWSASRPRTCDRWRRRRCVR